LGAVEEWLLGDQAENSRESIPAEAQRDNTMVPGKQAYACEEAA